VAFSHFMRAIKTYIYYYLIVAYRSSREREKIKGDDYGIFRNNLITSESIHKLRQFGGSDALASRSLTTFLPEMSLPIRAGS